MIVIRINLHNKLGNKDLQEIKYSLFSRIDYFTLPLEVDCRARNLPPEPVLLLPYQVTD